VEKPVSEAETMLSVSNTFVIVTQTIVFIVSTLVFRNAGVVVLWRQFTQDADLWLNCQ
jgi:hypothetical protein